MSFEIPTSDGRTRAAERAGVFHFPVSGAEQTLTAYVFEGDGNDSLFVPFVDATGSSETYGAGRYLDIEREEDGTYSNKDLVARRIRAVDLPHFHDVGRAVALPDRSLHRSLQRATRLPSLAGRRRSE